MGHVPSADCARCFNRFPVDEMVYDEPSVLLICLQCARETEEAMADKDEMYELFYFTGGHGGPYLSLQEAIDTARRYLRGNVRERRIDIKPYTKDGYGPVCAVVRVMGPQDIDPDTIVVEHFKP